ncbi:MAG TPA: M48 family metalloprotease [Vicinamibacterales bacterium]|nr:M48 family metalloprotease [Vicinamibacterales bacterium]HPW19822.1 M48 family metalloprotease [Vicinamibacterales bacterium]
MKRHILIGGLAACSLLACATNPVTGDRQLNFMSEAQEIQLGRESDPQLRAEMGVYPDQALQRYVESVGMRLAKSSERPDLPWQFAVVDVAAANAFAVPGGFIYITRGLLAHLDTEAELAGVLGHEIGHVTARHSAAAYTRSTMATVGMLLTSLFAPKAKPYMGAVEAGLSIALLKYDRTQELQADRLGAGYAAKVGWAPSGMSGVLETLGRISAASDSRGLPNWLSTHPQPADRLTKLAETVRALESARPSSEWEVNREAYWRHLDGLLYGDNPREGFLRGREFVHPDMRFTVTFPDGWRVQNGRQQVTSAPPGIDGVVILLQVVQNPQGASLERVAAAWMSQTGFQKVSGESVRLGGGVPAYHGVYSGQTENGAAVGVEAAHISHAGRVFLLAGVASQARFAQVQPHFARTIRSYSPANEAEMARVKPNRIAFATVASGDTWQSIAQRTGGLVPAGELAIVNGHAPDSRPPVGRRIKTVTQGS